MEQLNLNHELTILLINIAFTLLGYLFVYPRFAKDNLTKLTKLNTILILFSLGIVGFLFWGDERSFTFLFFETSWWVFWMLSSIALDVVFSYFYMKKWNMNNTNYYNENYTPTNGNVDMKFIDIFKSNDKSYVSNDMNFLKRFAKYGELKYLQQDYICEFEGIRIVDEIKDEQNFKESITRSLLYIKELDPKRYATVKNEIHWLVNSYQVSKNAGQYGRINRVCFINHEAYSETSYFESSQLISLDYAGLIVHEATHGLLFSKGFDYTKENRVQVERICTAEQNRFYKKVENAYPEYKGILVFDFKPEDWHDSWNSSLWTFLLQYIKRRME